MYRKIDEVILAWLQIRRARQQFENQSLVNRQYKLAKLCQRIS